MAQYSTSNIVHSHLPQGLFTGLTLSANTSISTAHIIADHFGPVGQGVNPTNSRFTVSVNEVQSLVDNLLINGIGKLVAPGNVLEFHYKHPSPLGARSNGQPLQGLKLFVRVNLTSPTTCYPIAIKTVYPCTLQGKLFYLFLSI